MATFSTSPVAQTRKRRWYQFSLRAVLIFVLVVSIPLGWFARRLDRAQRQKAAVAAISRAGGSVGYDFSRAPEGERYHYYDQLEPHTADFAAWELHGRTWMHDWFGIDFAYQVEEVAYTRVYPTMPSFPFRIDMDKLPLHPHQSHPFQPYDTGSDATLALVIPLSGLRELHAYGPDVTDAGIAHLIGLTRLECLCLHRTSVTDESLSNLQSMPQLRYLDLSGSKVTARGAERLRLALPECVIELDTFALK